MITRRVLVLAAFLIALLTFTAIASAKSVPYVEPLDDDWGSAEDPFVSPSRAFFANFFGRLEADDVDAVSLYFDQPVDAMHVELLVPECGDLLREFYPALAVMGPGLDAPDRELLADLPFELGEDAGLAVLADGAAPDTDKARVADVLLFDWMYYGENLNLQVDIPQAGDYTFVVWQPESSVGAYALTAGASHPGPVEFPDERTLRETSRLLDSGEWVGLDCATGHTAK